MIKNFEVRLIEHKVAKSFIEKWHYSKNCPRGLNVFFGAFIENELYAVTSYGMGSNMDKGAALARQTGLPVRFQNITQEWLNSPPKNTNVRGLTVGNYNCFELKRLCRQGAKGESRIPLTRFLSICHRILKREHSIHYVVSYSDNGVLHATKVDGRWVARPPDGPGMSGGIYRAANFRHLGQTAPETHTVRESDGQIFHRRIAYKEMKRWNAKHPDAPVSLAEVRKNLGRVPIVTPPKERWFIEL